MAWDGKERRSEDRKSLYEQMGEMRVRIAHIENAMDEMTTIKTDVTEIKQLLTQGKGMAKLLQLMFYVVGPLVAAIYWLKDNLR